VLGRLRELLTTTEEWVCPPELWEEARKEIIQSKERVKSTYDKHRHNQTKYTVCEVVVMIRVPVTRGESTKLQERYRRPLVVTKVLSNDIYRVAQLAEDNRRHFATTAHVSQLKSWKIGKEEADVGEESMIPDNEISEELGSTPTEAEITTEQNVLLPTDVRRSERVKKKPVRLQDYIITNDKTE
jgi:hypothetical protein